MARPLKLYSYARRRTRVASASLPQKKGSNSRWKKLIFSLGKAARLNFSRRTRQARCRYSNSMTVHTYPSRLQSAGIWRDFNLNPTS